MGWFWDGGSDHSDGSQACLTNTSPIPMTGDTDIENAIRDMAHDTNTRSAHSYGPKSTKERQND